METRDETLGRVGFSENQREIAQRELDDARGALGDRERAGIDRDGLTKGDGVENKLSAQQSVKDADRDPSIVHQEKQRSALVDGERTQYTDSLYRDQQGRCLSVTTAVDGNDRGLMNARSQIEAAHRMVDGVGRSTLESYERHSDGKIFQIPTHSQKVSGLPEHQSEQQPREVSHEHLQARISEYTKK